MIPKNTSKVLDVGTRDGFIPLMISHFVDYAVAIDIDSTLLQAREDILPIVGDASLLPVRDSSFDLVICLELLEHLPRES